MFEMMGVFKVAGFVLGGLALLFVVGVIGFFWVKRQGALRGQ